MSAGRKLVFVERDGALLEAPAGGRLDACAKLRFAAGVIPALLKLRDAGYALVLADSRAGAIDTAAEAPAQSLLLELLASQGIAFEAVRMAGDGAERALDRLLDYLRAGDLDAQASALVAAGEPGLALARELGVRGLVIGAGAWAWPELAHQLADAPRTAEVERVTHETRVRVAVDLDREARAEVATGIGFFDHMLEQLARHGGFALTLVCAGDTHVDEHHTVEDSALALGEALRRALGDKRGIARYGFTLPMDEARAEALLDLSGRAHFTFDGAFARERVGELPTELVPHFFRSLADALGANLQLAVRGENTHHMVEACFKSTARALRQALRRDGAGAAQVPSTKGVL